MDSSNRQDFIPCGNTSAFLKLPTVPDTSVWEGGRKETPFFFLAKSVLIIWETRIYLLLALFSLKMPPKT